MNEFNLIQQWLALKETNLSPHTIGKYRLAVNRFGLFLKERDGASLLQATLAHALLFVNNDLPARGLSPKSRQVYTSGIKSFYTWAHKMGFLPSNPLQEMPMIRASKCLPRPISKDDIERIMAKPDLDTFYGLRDTCMMYLLIGTGCRISGLVALNEDDVIWKNGLPVSVRVKEKGRGGKRERIIPLPKAAGLVLAAYLGHEKLKAWDRDIGQGKKLLFLSFRNRRHHWGAPLSGEQLRITADGVRCMLKKYAAMAGIQPQNVMPHRWRHAYGTSLADDGVQMDVIGELMGHQDLNTTRQYLLLGERMRNVIDNHDPLGKLLHPLSALEKGLNKAGKKANGSSNR